MRRARTLIGLTALLASGVLARPVLAVASTSAQTGNLLVLLDQHRAHAEAVRSAVDATIASVGARLAGKSVPEIGLITVRPPVGVAPSALAAVLRALPGVQSVQFERRYVPRLVPADPALSTTDPSSGVPYQWTLGREDFYRAWDITKGDGALVGVIDTGVDGAHPDLQSKIVAAVDQETGSSTGPASTDQVGHGTHVASLACADTGNGLGMAGAGYNCDLVIEKSDFSDSSIAAAIVDATDRQVQAINMSFGPSTPTSAPAPDSEVRALDYAAAHKVVLVAAAADSPSTEQGDPANLLQPAGTGPLLDQGLGLDVTAADYNGARASFAGSGTEISMAAFGAFNAASASLLPCSGAPVGVFGAYPANSTPLESFPPSACRTTFQGDNRYAYLAGTSMAAPQVAATAAMMRVLNPYASLPDVVRTLKQTAQRPAGAGWTNDLGWGILDAGAALDAIRRLDRLPPVSHLYAPRLTHRRVFELRWFGRDQQRPGLIASGIAYYELYVSVNGGRLRLLARTTHQTLRFRGRPGFRYAFELFAVDRAGNREVHPLRLTTRVARRAR
jgi:subtilisin family serine protease